MNKYKFTYKRRFFEKTIEVIGHRYDSSQDKMALYLEDGGIEEIAHWKDCSLKLGTDWVLAVKAEMEQKAGQTIPINRNLG